MCRFCEHGHAIDRQVYESSNFRVIVALGALVEGWLLIIPKKHMLALASMTPDLQAEYEEVVSIWRSKMEHAYGDVAEFEHGPGQCGSPVGCTIDHAHSHLVPTTLDLLSAANAYLPNTNWSPVGSVTDLAEYHHNQQAYLFVRQNNQAWAAIAPSFPSQLFRRIIADDLKVKEFDWRNDYREDLVIATLRNLSRRARSVTT